MTDRVDLLIRARFDAVANPSDDRDWTDVLTRAQGSEIPVKRSVGRTGVWRRVPARVALVAAVVVLAAVVTAVAFGWPQRVVDFFSSAPAPTHVKHSIGAFGVDAPPGMDPRVVPGQTRRITTARFNAGRRDARPRLHTLYVAPTKSRGFCYLWTGGPGGCVDAGTDSFGDARGPLGVTFLTGSDIDGLPPDAVYGWVRLGATRTVEARFADGATATIPVTWVSAPINAGFLAYPVPRSHRDRADALTSVVALDVDGQVLGTENTIPAQRRRNAFAHWVTHTLPNGMKAAFPPDAEVAKARKIISFRATDRSQVYLWLVPLTRGGHCFVSNAATALGTNQHLCTNPHALFQSPILDGGLQGGGTRILFFALAKPAVATVELRYQNHERERLTPIDGFVVHELGPAHWKRGTRLVAAVALNRSGKAIGTQRFQTQEPGMYPCKKRVNRGYGVESCP